MSPRFDPKRKQPATLKQQMVRLVLAVARKAKVKMAIGGGIAVASRGYVRETRDVDAFFHEKDRQKVLRALTQLASDWKVEAFDRSHWVAIPPGARTIEERIDFLFAEGDPEESAIEMASSADYEGQDIPAFTTDWIVVSKFLATRDEPKDALDILALYQRGGFDVKDVVKRLRQMGMKEDAARFPVFLEKLRNLKRRDD